MSRKVILYILLALGIVIIGGGDWLLYDSTTGDNPEGNPVTINIPQGNPVIYEQSLYTMRGENYELYIYDNGSILYIEEKGLRFPSPEHPATRTWSTGNFTVEQVNNLLAYFENSGLGKLDEYYSFPGKPNDNGPDGSFTTSDMSFTIIVNSDNLNKKVTAFGYLSPDKDETYPDMPSPLDDIYGRLRTIAMITEKIASENIE
ncbi:MAG: hypothetical protein WC370_01920 [Dehalococcoidales bacterium]|jgi:hypothetical protein